MAPPPPTKAQIQRLATVSIVLHGLVGSAHVVGLVFTAIAGNRDDNTSFIPSSSNSQAQSPAQRAAQTLPAVRLVLFGTLFTLYLVLKAFEVAVSKRYFSLKRWMDEGSLLIAGASLVSMVYISTIWFTTHVAGPAYTLVVFGWIFFRVGWMMRFFEWSYIRFFKSQKAYRICSHKLVLKRSVLKCTKANLAYNDACKAVTTKLSFEDLHNAVSNAEEKKQIVLDAIQAVFEAQESIDLCRKEWDLKIEEAAIAYEEPEVEPEV